MDSESNVNFGSNEESLLKDINEKISFKFKFCSEMNSPLISNDDAAPVISNKKYQDIHINEDDNFSMKNYFLDRENLKNNYIEKDNCLINNNENKNILEGDIHNSFSIFNPNNMKINNDEEEIQKKNKRNYIKEAYYKDELNSNINKENNRCNNEKFENNNKFQTLIKAYNKKKGDNSNNLKIIMENLKEEAEKKMKEGYFPLFVKIDNHKPLFFFASKNLPLKKILKKYLTLQGISNNGEEYILYNGNKKIDQNIIIKELNIKPFECIKNYRN